MIFSQARLAVSLAESEMGSIVPVVPLEDMDVHWHLAMLLELWNNPVTFPTMVQLDNHWIACGAAGTFLD
jgi:hypothetical protein